MYRKWVNHQIVLMKNLIWIALFFLSACQVVTYTEYVIDDGVAKLIVGNDATEEMLEEIAQEFEEIRGIELDYTGSKFENDGRITYLKLKVKTKGSTGGVESNYRATDRRFGFIVDYKAEGGAMLKTGLMEE